MVTKIQAHINLKHFVRTTIHAKRAEVLRNCLEEAAREQKKSDLKTMKKNNP